MNILITGSAGFIGFSVSNYLLSNYNNIKIVGIDNLNNYYSTKLKLKRNNILKKFKNYKFKKIDIVNKKKINNFLKKKKIDLIIHLAAQAGVRYSLLEPEEYIQSNQLGFFNILNFAKNKKIRMIYASSSSVYGETKKFPLYEKEKLNPNNLYSITKENNEKIAEIFSKFYNLNLIGLRFFTIFGEWGRPDMLPIKYLKSVGEKKKFQIYNFGNHYRDFTYIKDAIQMLIPLVFLKKFKGHNIFNICSNNPKKLIYIINFLQKKNKYKNISFIKKQTADVYKTHGSNKRILKISKLKKFTKFENALNNTYNWYLKNKNLIISE